MFFMQHGRGRLAAAFLGVAIMLGAVVTDAASAETNAIDRFLGNQPQFVELAPFNITVIREGAVSRLVSLTITVETYGIADRDRVLGVREKLHNRFLRDLHGILSVRTSPRAGEEDTFDANSVKIRLMRRAAEILGPDIVRDVLIKTAYSRKVR